jgi:hypothetical protein
MPGSVLTQHNPRVEALRQISRDIAAGQLKALCKL